MSGMDSAAEARWQRVQRLASIGSWEVDFETSQLTWSEESYRIYQVEPNSETLTRQTFREFVHPDDAERVYQEVDQARRIGRPYNVEHRVILRDGTVKHLREYAEPVRGDDGAVRGLAGVVQDITEFKRLEEQFLQAQKLESVGRLAGGVAHDFNNLLQIINGFSEMLLAQMEETNSAREHIRMIRDAGERAASLTRQLLAFSRRQPTEPRPVNLNDLLSEHVRLLRPLIGDTITLELHESASIGFVQADEGQLHQVLLNLVLNARDAMPDGGSLILGTGQTQSSAGPMVFFSVRDTGTGMPDDVKQHMFEPFFTTKPEGEGVGLGLPTVYGIVSQHGGTIEVESELGQGATFRVLLPRAETPGASTSQAKGEPGNGSGQTVLVVDDDDQIRRLACTALASFGYVAIEAPNSQAALDLIGDGAQRIDLVLTDVMLPEMSGVILAQRIMQSNPGVRVLLMSGYSVQDPAAEGLEIIGKPFKLAELAASVRKALAGPPASPHS